MGVVHREQVTLFLLHRLAVAGPNARCRVQLLHWLMSKSCAAHRQRGFAGASSEACGHACNRRAV